MCECMFTKRKKNKVESGAQTEETLVVLPAALRHALTVSAQSPPTATVWCDERESEREGGSAIRIVLFLQCVGTAMKRTEGGEEKRRGHSRVYLPLVSSTTRTGKPSLFFFCVCGVVEGKEERGSPRRSFFSSCPRLYSHFLLLFLFKERGKEKKRNEQNRKPK